MSVRFLAAVLAVALSCINLAAAPLAQAQGAGTAQPARPAQQDDPVNPFVGGILQLLEEELNRANNNDDAQPPAGGGSTNGDDVQVADRQGPVITPVQNNFESTRGSARILADIRDASGVARAVVVGDGGRIAMASAGGVRYAASVPLPPHYRPTQIAIQAWDRRQNPSRAVPVTILRIPGCGRADDVTVGTVKSVQRSLTGLGRYGGGIDGLAGPNTCGALKDEGIVGSFSWPVIARELEWRVGVVQIALEVNAPPEATGPTTPVRVRVQDPRQTDAVGVVRMRIDGAAAGRKKYSGRELRFDVDLAEGATSRITFEAIDRRTGDILATETVTLSRPGPMTLLLSAEGLNGDRLRSDAAELSVMARVEGSDKARIFFHNRSNGQRGVIEFFGTPVAMPVVMPAAGRQGHIVFWVEDGNRKTPQRRIDLERILLPGPEVTTLPPVRPAPPQADTAPDWNSDASQAGRGVDPQPLIPQVADKVPERMVSPPPPPPPPVNDWLVPVGIGVVVVIALLAAIVGLFRRGFRRPGAETIAGAPNLRVVTHPDMSPTVEVSGADLPSLVLTVSPGAAPTALMVFETDLERAAE